MSLALIVVLLLVLGAELVNGWTDAPNAIATTVGTRALKPLQAVLMASVFNLRNGMVADLSAPDAARTIEVLESAALGAWSIG